MGSPGKQRAERPGLAETAAVRCPSRAPDPPTPSQPRPSEGYGPLGQALRSGLGPEGRGADFRDISLGKGYPQSGLSQLPGGWEAGNPPQPQIGKYRQQRR